MNKDYNKIPGYSQKDELAVPAGSLCLRGIDYFDTQPGTLPYVARGNRQLFEAVSEVEQFDVRPEDN
jgi:hypothetical protein